MEWKEELVASPYGDVRTLHWAAKDPAEDQLPDCGEEDEEVTQLKLELESAEDELGAVLWNSNTPVLKYLHDRLIKEKKNTTMKKGNDDERFPFRGELALELGAGVGCLGIALAFAGAHAIVTDMKELVPLMRRNILLNAATLESKATEDSSSSSSANVGNVSSSGSQEKKKELAFRCEGCTLRWGDKVLAQQVQDAVKLHRTNGYRRGLSFVVMCDALYGNPQIWPRLVFDLKRLSCLNEDGKQEQEDQEDHKERLEQRPMIYNFCEQRVRGVEDKFVELLESEGASSWTVERTVLEQSSALSIPIHATAFRYVGPFLPADSVFPKEPKPTKKKAAGAPNGKGTQINKGGGGGEMEVPVIVPSAGDKGKSKKSSQSQGRKRPRDD